jgi:hypothetical protein
MTQDSEKSRKQHKSIICIFDVLKDVGAVFGGSILVTEINKKHPYG